MKDKFFTYQIYKNNASRKLTTKRKLFKSSNMYNWNYKSRPRGLGGHVWTQTETALVLRHCPGMMVDKVFEASPSDMNSWDSLPRT